MRTTKWIAVAMVLACAVSAMAWRQPPEPATATKVIHYTPPATMPDAGRSGFCWVGSIADPYRTDSWRCMEGNAIHDPCFRLSDRKAVVCGANPATGTHGFKLNLTKPLPESDAHPAPTDHPWPWLVELTDGTTCMRFTGTAPFVDGQAGYYGCPSQDKGRQTLLLGNLDNTHPLWTAQKAILVKSRTAWHIQSSQSVPVRAVWE